MHVQLMHAFEDKCTLASTSWPVHQNVLWWSPNIACNSPVFSDDLLNCLPLCITNHEINKINGKNKQTRGTLEHSNTAHVYCAYNSPHTFLPLAHAVYL